MIRKKRNFLKKETPTRDDQNRRELIPNGLKHEKDSLTLSLILTLMQITWENRGRMGRNSTRKSPRECRGSGGVYVEGRHGAKERSDRMLRLCGGIF